MNVNFILLMISAIIFFGFLSEFISKKTKIPNILALILLGFFIGPYGLKYINLESISPFVPLFTTFTLIFILFDGAFSLDIKSMIKELPYSLLVTIVNFFVSSLIIAVILLFFGFSISISIMTGFMLGGISSSFVIPLLKGFDIKKNSYSLLTLESALTDILCIVFTIAMIEFIKLQSFNISNIVIRIISLFGMAGFVGISGGIIWIVLVSNFFKEHKTYMDTIAFLILIYVVTEYLHGNGALAALFFGIMLKNSKLITSFIKNEDIHFGVSVTKPSEKVFFDQITFFIKTFFFVYIGALFDISNIQALVIGTIISVSLMIVRNVSSSILINLKEQEKSLLNSVFGRGIAAAVLAQIVIEMNIPYALLIEKVVYVVIVETIVLSSIRVFITRKMERRKEEKTFKLAEVKKNYNSSKDKSKDKSVLIDKKVKTKHRKIKNKSNK